MSVTGTGRVADDVYDGKRCAVCERLFTVAELLPFSGELLFLNETGHFVHKRCWDDDEVDETSPIAVGTAGGDR